MVGHKLATILGGVVKSAPVINEPIRGGRASIHMGASDVASQEHERDVLVEVLRAGSQLPDGKLVDWSYVAPARAFEWGLRATLAVLAGLVAAALALLAIRFA